MKKLFVLFLVLGAIFQSKISFAQRINYSDGIEDLMEVKSLSEDLTRAIKLEWDHNSDAYAEAKVLYNKTKRTVDNMIATFDARIRSGDKISKDDVDYYVGRATESCEALSNHYNQQSAAGGTNALFGIDKILVKLPEMIDSVMNVFNKIKEHQIQARLTKMHNALDPCKLVDWELV